MQSKAMASKSANTLISSFGKYSVLTFFAALSLLPVVMSWLMALRPKSEASANPFSWPSRLEWSNFSRAWEVGRFGDYFINSIMVTIPTVIAVVVLSALAGYGISRFKFRGRNVMFYTLLLGLTIPFQSVMIPLFYQLNNMGLLGTYWAMILPATAFGLPFGVFLMQAFFEDLPNELADAARVDGCSEWRIFKDVMLPLAKPAISSLIVFQFMATWNNFIMPLLFLQEESIRTVPLGLLYFQGKYTRDLTLLSAGVAIATIPIVIIYVLFQRQFVKGLTAGAVK
jgi:raffinose/stachyose/melibiose transport system permease protein